MKGRKVSMKQIRSAGLAMGLLVANPIALRAEQLLFGSESLPKVSSDRKVRISDGQRSWRIPVSTKTTTRLIQIVGLGPEKNITAELVCSRAPVPVHNKSWVVAKGECALTFTPNVGVASEDVKLTALAGNLESGRIADPLSDEQLSKADQGPVRVALTLQADASGAGAVVPADGDSTSLVQQLRPVLIVFCITMVVAIIGALFFFKYGPRSRRTKPKVRDEFEDEPRVTPPPRAVAGAAPTRPGNRLASEIMGPNEPQRQESPIEKTQNEHSRLLMNLDARTQAVEARIEQVVESYIVMLRESAAETQNRIVEMQNSTSRRLHDVEGRVDDTEERLADHLSGQSSKLQDLFKDLPTLANLSVTARVLDKSALSQLEGQLISAVKQSALSNTQQESLQADSRSLIDALRTFVPIATRISREKTKKRLERLVTSVELLDNELATLGQLAGAQKYGFFVEMSLVDKNPLASDITAALQRELTKLNDPEGYYLKRLAAARAQVSVAAIDLTDLDLDSERRNTVLQEALGVLLRSLGMTEIDPGHNEKLQASDHQVLQFARRESGAFPGTVAHTMARGIRRGGEVVRKASVLVYD